MTFRYHYSRQIRESGRLIEGDNFVIVNKPQYNLGFTLTHVFSTGRWRFLYGFGQSLHFQDVVDGNDIRPFVQHVAVHYHFLQRHKLSVLRSMSRSIAGSMDHQLVYNHTMTWRATPEIWDRPSLPDFGRSDIERGARLLDVRLATGRDSE